MYIHTYIINFKFKKIKSFFEVIYIKCRYIIIYTRIIKTLTLDFLSLSFDICSCWETSTFLALLSLSNKFLSFIGFSFSILFFTRTSNNSFCLASNFDWTSFVSFISFTSASTAFSWFSFLSDLANTSFFKRSALASTRLSLISRLSFSSDISACIGLILWSLELISCDCLFASIFLT